MFNLVNVVKVAKVISNVATWIGLTSGAVAYVGGWKLNRDAKKQMMNDVAAEETLDYTEVENNDTEA